MCGFIGTLIFEGGSPSGHATLDRDILRRMRDVMAHRGPNGAGEWFSDDGTIGLGFRRLSIIDLSTTADQPMASLDGRFQLVFNGEIYNHAAIRRELLSLGWTRWKTDHSDTEVILRAFEAWGIGAVERFRGMFAFALWDRVKRELWLVRDRIGIKPLYYSIHHGRISFGSEIKALLQDPLQRRAVNEDAFFDYLSFLTSPAPETLFEGIKKLPGGTYLKVTSKGQIFERRYWDALDGHFDAEGQSDDTIAAGVLQELRTAVALRKVSDVPVGVFLSGGIDSSANAVLFSEGENQPVRSFTIGYQGQNPSVPNETDHARKVAGMIGAEHREILLGEDDLLGFLDRMVYLQDEPIADPVCVPVYFVSKLARDHGVIVCQVGEGADELFWGYRSWQQFLFAQRVLDLPMPRALKSLAYQALRLRDPREPRSVEILKRASLGQPIFWGGAEAFSDAQKKQLLGPRLRERFKHEASWRAIAPIRERYLKRSSNPSPLQWMSYIDLNMRLPELLLMRVDKMSMGVSLEGRVPFLDHKFVEKVLAIPEAVKTRNNVPKALLKRALRGILPSEILHREKQGFGVPVHEWFQSSLGSRMADELRDFCQKSDILDAAAVEALIASGKSSQLWFLFNFVLWWKMWIEGSPTTGAA